MNEATVADLTAAIKMMHEKDVADHDEVDDRARELADELTEKMPLGLEAF